MELSFCLIYGALIVGSYCLPPQLFEGDKCKNTDSHGVCTQLQNCPRAVKEVRQKHHHHFTRCGFDDFTEIVCCPQENSIRISERVCNEYKTEVYNTTSMSITSRILGGIDAVELEFPHMVALGYYHNKKKTYSFSCGSTLISDKYIVTTAHCIEPTETVLKIARMGSIMLPLETTEIGPAFHDYHIKKVIKHPRYDKTNGQNDIALLELEQKVIFSKNIRPACLYTVNDDPKLMVNLGWERLGVVGLTDPVLQKIDVFSVPLHECTKMYSERINGTIDSGQICALSPKGAACLGDSGGPLRIAGDNVMMKDGTTSFGECCGGPLPGVYVTTNSYLEWIERIVWNCFEH